MSTSSKKTEQLEKSLKKVINDIIYRKINDPRINFLTITKIQASSDLKHAKIYISIYGDEDHNKKCLEGLKSATKFIRGEIGRQLKVRFVPEIEFKMDESIEYQYKLLKLISEIHQEQPNKKKGKNEKKIK